MTASICSRSSVISPVHQSTMSFAERCILPAVFLVSLALARPQDNIVFYDTQINVCTITNTSNTGSCVPIKFCPQAIRQVQEDKHPDLCGFQGLDPIVCCEDLASTIKPQPSIAVPLKDPLVNELFPPSEAETTSSTITITSQRTNPPKTKLPVGDWSRQRCRQTESVSQFTSGRKDNKPLHFQYSHMAALGFGEENNKTFMCSGSLVGNKHVLTSAHCLHYTEMGMPKFIVAGDLNLQRTDDRSFPQRFDVTKIIPHPDYQADNGISDIALLELNLGILHTSTVSDACLQVDDNINLDSWASTGYPQMNDSSNELKMNMMKPAPGQCGEDVNQLCAEFLDENDFIADLDGPLQVKADESLTYTIIGVLSQPRQASSFQRRFRIYTKISNYIEWIESVVTES